jgi:hypothetical protein
MPLTVVLDHRHHGVAMAAQHEGVHVADRDAEFPGEEGGEARRIQHAGHADNLVGGQAREFAQRPDHRVERVGDADHESVGSVGLDAFAHGLHHLQVDAQQVVAAHAGLRGTPAVTMITSAPAMSA